MDRTTAPDSSGGFYVNASLIDPGTLVIAEDKNAQQEETINIIKDSNLVPSSVDDTKSSQAIQIRAQQSAFYDAAFVLLANRYDLSVLTPRPVLPYEDGQKIEFIPPQAPVFPGPDPNIDLEGSGVIPIVDRFGNPVGSSVLLAGIVFKGSFVAIHPVTSNPALVPSIASLQTGLITAELVFEIGPWNMDSTASVSIPHGLVPSTIVFSFAQIRNDAGTLKSPMCIGVNNFGGVGANAETNNGPNVVVTRNPDSLGFDNVNYSSLALNRGWITLKYLI